MFFFLQLFRCLMKFVRVSLDRVNNEHKAGHNQQNEGKNWILKYRVLLCWAYILLKFVKDQCPDLLLNFK